ncbi:hypothetical protein JHK82_014398 [Glycine max]|uniref:Uncharacterized protein n=1 Tax=Glycine soja TaxID=3848 RepID=A0A0B2SJ72_GLYSO|nr:hypothetical protein JHK87_014309 [Glycine soja]KAG5045020.1 hypothetical protein JHK86_014426 [Glycine max]KAG5147517.1 hypothetical protein JHK82_014398 [Glycine max]KHN45120.1 hypothetical protein glysoja_031348 [Glycine soja]
MKRIDRTVYFYMHGKSKKGGKSCLMKLLKTLIWGNGECRGPIVLLFLAHAPPSRLVNQIPPNTILYCVIMDRKGLNWEMGAIEAKFNV